MVVKDLKNRRSYLRVEAPVYCRPARLRLTPLPVANIGLGGMRVYSDNANKVGQILDIDVLVGGETITCTVEVAWLSHLSEPAPAKYDVGLRFVSVPAGFLHYLNKFTVSDGSGTVAIIVNPGHQPLAAEPLRRLMIELDDMAALIVHDKGDCTCLAEVDKSTSWLERISFMSTDTATDLRRGAFALNAALRRALGREHTTSYYLLVQPDVVVEVGAINALRNVLLEQAHVGVVASYVVDAEGAQQPTVFRFPTYGRPASIRRSLRDHTGPVPWVSATCVMIRRDVLDQIGLLDDTMYDRFQAADLCRRAALAGWQTWLVSGSTVTSSTLSPFDLEHTPARDRPLFLASRDRFLSKNYGRFSTWWSAIGTVIRLALTSWRRTSRDLLAELWRYYLRPRWPAPPGAPRKQ